VPGVALLRSYQRIWLRADFVAGLTLSAYLLPASIGDAFLAGLPPQAGLYACLFSGLVFWLFCSSRHTTITATSAISLLVGSSLAGLAAGDPARFGALAACTALLVALIALLAWVVRAGAIVNFISETVLIGFKAGVAFYLASTQLPKLFGFKGGEGSFWQRSGHFIAHLGETNPTALILGLSALAILVLGKIFLTNKPVGLFVVVYGIVVATQLNIEARGVKILGDVPQGMPHLGLPAVYWSDLNDLLPLAIACFMLGAVETAAIGRMFTAKHGGRFDSNQEFLGLAAGNLFAGLGQGFPVSGGMSQSLVNEGGGARTPLSGLVAAAVMLIVILFFSSALRNLPQPVLAAIVLFAVAGLFKVSELRHLWRADRSEFIVAIAALLGVLGSGLLRGVMIGAVIAMVQLLRRGSQPHVASLGRIPGTHRFSDVERNPENERVPGMMILRFESSLLYFNVEYVRDAVLKRVRRAAIRPRLVVCDLSASPHVDLQSAATLGGLADELNVLGVEMQIVEARSSVRDRLRAEGLDEKFGGIDRFRTVAQVVGEFERREAA
ncbi:MAG TPA: SulP family inorganic anion transporter, partial [Pyrinomonadaceae bacterium]|nr:SulP family inorganic anion transporter [Pyrinomonadaceae bacterium]